MKSLLFLIVTIANYDSLYATWDKIYWKKGKDLYIRSDKSYFTKVEAVQLNCGMVQWNPETVVVFYQNGFVFFNSSKYQAGEPWKLQMQGEEILATLCNALAPIVYVVMKMAALEIRDDRALILRHLNGLEKMSCSVNNVVSVNTLTIPYVIGPWFEHKPSEFKLNTSHVFKCCNRIRPKIEHKMIFYHNDIPIAQLKNLENQFQLLEKVDGLSVTPGPPNSDDSITIRPTLPENAGNYRCEVKFDVKSTSEKGKEFKTVTLPTKYWVTSDVLTWATILKYLAYLLAIILIIGIILIGGVLYIKYIRTLL